MNNRLIKSNDAGGGACTNTVDLYNPFPDGGGVALYQLNGDATDVSGNYDGAINGSISFSQGTFGQRANFVSSSYINVPSNFFVGRTVYSISFWMSNTTTGALFNRVLFFAGALYYYADEYFGYTMPGMTPGDSNFRLSTSGIDRTQVHHYVITVDNGTATLYVDGQFKDSYTSAASTYYTNNYFEIGTSNTSYPFVGSFDQVRIFNRALRPYEVEALYTEEYCTPTIVPSEHFNTVTYTGTGATNARTDVGFQPDFTWIKSRSNPSWHSLQDSVRGATKTLFSNETNSEVTYTNAQTSFDSNGFTLGADTEGGSVNVSGRTYVSWNFKAGGAAVTNTDGTITSQVSANTEAGFSVVSYTGNGSTATVGHGLDSIVDLLIVKGRETTNDWSVLHKDNTNGNFLQLNGTAAESGSGSIFGNPTARPTDSVFTIGNTGETGTLNKTYIAYCFAEVEGFSNFGSYVGAGYPSTVSVVTGFEPAFVMIKASNLDRNWVMVDNKRGYGNNLSANTSLAEYLTVNGQGQEVEFLENGFKVNANSSWTNNSGTSYIYMAFAADPTAVEPSLEDSFNTVLYSGNSSTQSVTGVGFQPDFTWIKSRNASWSNMVTDSVTGGGLYLSTNTANAQAANSSAPTFDSDGFTLGGGNTIWNGSGLNYVAWNWKGAEIPAINSNGSITSVVSANPAAGFSIVSYTAGGTANVGHGLGSAPAVIITKNLDVAEQWFVYHKDVGTQKFLGLNTTSAAISNSGVYTSITDATYTNNISSTSRTYINYCFAEVAGFSKFGSYTGNGSNQYINLGFEPAFIMVKRTDNTGTWGMFDNKRGLAAPQPRLLANDSSSENTGTTYFASTDSTGFTVQGSSIYGSGEFIYMAFANQF